MKAKQYWVVFVAIALIAAIYSFGTTKFPAKSFAGEAQKMNITSLLETARGKLTPAQQNSEKQLQAALSGAHNASDSALASEELLHFWGNEAKNAAIASWYLAQKAKLENSEKSLTFAANFILENIIQGQDNDLANGWKAGLAGELFTEALKKNPENDSIKTGLGASYLFGQGDQTMKGVGMILQQLQKDSTNAYAHKMLGFGNIRNGELKKAIARFENALRYNPADVSLIPMLALLCKDAGELQKANEWYEKAKPVLKNNPEMLAGFEAEFNRKR